MERLINVLTNLTAIALVVVMGLNLMSILTAKGADVIRWRLGKDFAYLLKGRHSGRNWLLLRLGHLASIMGLLMVGLDAVGLVRMVLGTPDAELLAAMPWIVGSAVVGAASARWVWPITVRTCISLSPALRVVKA